MRKIFLLFVLTISVFACSMEKEFFNVTQNGYCNISMNEMMAMQLAVQHEQPDVLPLVIGGSQLFSLCMHYIPHLIKWKNQRSLFGSVSMPDVVRDFVDWNIPFSFASSLLMAYGLNVGSKHEATQAWCITNCICMTKVLADMVFLSNAIHQDALESVKKYRPNQLIIKQMVDITRIPDARCLIGYENDAEREYVNPCEQADHIYCADCLSKCFQSQKNKLTFINQESFLCDFCRKEVPFNDEKFEFVQSKVTLKACVEQLTKFRAILYLIGLWTLGVLFQSCF